MDTDSLSFCYEEHFPSYESSDFLDADDDTQNDDKLFEPRYWDWETEQELNGDIALIPMSSGVSTNYLSNSPPVREDIQKIMSEWQELMNEVSELEAFTTDMSLSDESHDITVDNVPAVKSNQRLPGKKIDTTAQCYILNDPSTFIKSEPKEEDSGDSENDFIDVDTVSDQTTPILQAGDLNSLLEQFEATECYQPEPIPTTSAVIVKSESNASPVVETERNIDAPDENKQILDALPRELIMKINASSKRRVVPVIDAMPNKKRSRKVQEQTSTSSPEVSKPIKTEPIHLDHDYCSQSTPYPKYPQKDSGFESAEEDEQRNILRKQPTVKGADGKLMVSLLKINTIRNSIITENNTKRKLNLEEYKKRRQGVLRSRSNSLSNSPSSSGANSPAIIEDENIRLLKHQQKLMQMAEEVLKTPPKSALVQPPPLVSNTPDPVPEPEPVEAMPPPPRVPPKNIEVKTLVSMGVNTDISITDELLEIKPILQNANTKISDNSLINSVIKNIQKKKLETSTFIPKTTNKSKEQAHGEDKTIVYLDKNRSPVETKNVEIQTEPEVEDTSKHKRKRNTSSSSSSDSSEHKRTYKRSSSNESRSSYSSDSSSSSRSRSRSPRRYNKKYYKKEHERIKEVEERRIVYVGGISSSMSKETLRRRFQIFGPVTNVSVHFREYGDNYGFVTYMHKSDAYKAVEHGNDDCLLPKYDLSFGGRRIFCRTHYSDLDNVQDEKTYASQDDDSFDSLLREAKAKLRKRKSYS